MSAITKALPNPPANFSTTLASGITSGDTTITLDSVSGLPTEGVGVIYAKDADGDLTASSVEFIHWTNVSGSDLTLTDSGDRGLSGSASGAQAHSAGDTFEVWIHPEYHFYDWSAVEHADDGTHGAITATSIDLGSSTVVSSVLDEDNMASDSATALATQQSIKKYVDDNSGTGDTGLATATTDGPTTTSSSYATLAEMSVALTTTGGDVLVTFAGTIESSVANDEVAIAFQMDSDTEVGAVFFDLPSAGKQFNAHNSYLFTGVSSAAHTFKVRWKRQLGSGTITSSGTRRHMTACEIK